MNRENVAAIPVAEELEVIGSLALRDIKRNYSKLLKQTTTQTTEHKELWNSDDQRIEFDS